MRKLVVMSVTPKNNKSGKKEMKYFLEISSIVGVDIVVFPSSFLPYYKNSNAFYTESDIMKLPDIVVGNNLVVVGVNEITDSGELYKAVICFDGDGIVHRHRKKDIEEHYIKKGFCVGDGSDMNFIYNDISMSALECFELLFCDNYNRSELVFGSIGFGMLANTENYDCDYFDQWLNIIKANALRNNCFVVTSCNGQHSDYMTVCVNRNGDVVAMSREHGFFVVEIDLDCYRKCKQPFMQGDN